MTRTAPVVTVVVVSWNTRERLLACLDALDRSRSPFGVETIVVDNASADATPAAVRDHRPGVRLIQNDRNAGFAAACNQGIRASGERYVLLLNPDTEVHPDALRVLIETLGSRENAAAAGPLVVDGRGVLERSCHPFPTVGRELARLLHLDGILRIRYPMEAWGEDAVREVDALQGACLLLRRDVLDEVGLLDEGFFMYTEEIDLCRRIAAAGRDVLWVPRARVVHHGAESTRQVARSMFFRLYESKLRYIRKHHGRAAAFGYKLILGVTSLLRLLLSPFALFQPAARRHRSMTLAGRYAALLARLPGL